MKITVLVAVPVAPLTMEFMTASVIAMPSLRIRRRASAHCQRGRYGNRKGDSAYSSSSHKHVLSPLAERPQYEVHWLSYDLYDKNYVPNMRGILRMRIGRIASIRNGARAL
jgi:hypothetical protein